MRADSLPSRQRRREPPTDILRVVSSDVQTGRGPSARHARRRAGWIATLAFVFTGVALILRRFEQAARARTPLSFTDVQAAVDSGNHRYIAALEAGDARAYASVFTSDAVSMPAQGHLLRGRATIEASIAAAFDTMTFSGGSLRSSQLRVDGDTAYELGDYAFDVATGPATQHLTGRYLVIWRREGGEWKIAVDASQPGASDPIVARS